MRRWRSREGWHLWGIGSLCFRWSAAWEGGWALNVQTRTTPPTCSFLLEPEQVSPAHKLLVCPVSCLELHFSWSWPLSEGLALSLCPWPLREGDEVAVTDRTGLSGTIPRFLQACMPIHSRPFDVVAGGGADRQMANISIRRKLWLQKIFPELVSSCFLPDGWKARKTTTPIPAPPPPPPKQSLKSAPPHAPVNQSKGYPPSCLWLPLQRALGPFLLLPAFLGGCLCSRHLHASWL